MNDKLLPPVADPADIAQAVEVLRAGGVIAMPTDTVYGIAAAIDSPNAIERLFTIKGRAGTKAIPVLVDSADQIERFAAEVTPTAVVLARACWPGGLTIIVPARADVPDAILRGGDTVGLRMPASCDALTIIAQLGGALAVTSANRSGDREARSAAEVRATLGERVDFVVDGGPSLSDRPSTVVDATGTRPRILRHGAIPADRLLAALDAAE